MNVSELHDNYDIHPDVSQLIEQVEAKTGKPIEFLAIYNLNVDATTRIARTSIPQHVIRFKSTETERLNHLLAFSSAQILRILSAPSEERLVPATSKATLTIARDSLGGDLTRATLPKGREQEITQFWIEGLIRQLTNVPTDIFLNQWLRKKYPDLRFEQQASLRAEMTHNEQGLSKQVQRITPRKIFDASNAMNYVYRRELAEITGEKSTVAYRMFSGIINQGRVLQRILQEIGDQGHKGDREIIDRWADELGINKWFAWQSFDVIPENFL